MLPLNILIAVWDKCQCEVSHCCQQKGDSRFGDWNQLMAEQLQGFAADTHGSLSAAWVLVGDMCTQASSLLCFAVAFCTGCKGLNDCPVLDHLVGLFVGDVVVILLSYYWG